MRPTRNDSSVIRVSRLALALPAVLLDHVGELDDVLALLVFLVSFVCFQLCRNKTAKVKFQTRVTYVSPSNYSGALDAVNIGHHMFTCHHFFLTLGTKEYIDSKVKYGVRFILPHLHFGK